MEMAKSINPATGKLIKEYPRITAEDAIGKIDKAHQAFLQWRDTSLEERAKYLHRLADVLERNKQVYAELATNEMGKLLKQSVSELEKCAWVCRYYADNGAKLLQDEHITTEATKSYVTFQPLGVVLAVMPWNFPFYQVIRFVAPALMAGNGGVLKHASNVQGCAFALEAAIAKAGFPDGLFQNLNVKSDAIEAVIANDKIVAVTLTGSDPAGRSVASIAGKHLKKSVLELGGSDAYIILDDVDLDTAVETATYGRLQNNGQTCIAAKRFIVVQEIYDAFLEKFTKSMQDAKMAEPKDLAAFYGPMARVDLRDELHEQVMKTVEQGGTLHLGGKIPDREGAYYPASILTNLKPGMVGFDEELFGPVASVIKAKDEDEAVALANASEFGLGAGVLTGNKDRGERLALRLEAGNAFVNKLVASDPRLPFGGVKNSGYGRELSSYGIREFTNTKTIWIA